MEADNDGYQRLACNSLCQSSHGGTGLIILKATVESRGLIKDRDLGIWDDSHIKGIGKDSKIF